MDPFDRYLQENIKISSTTTKTQNTSNSENVTVIDDDLIYFKYNSDEYYCTKQEFLLSVTSIILLLIIIILLLVNRKMKKNKFNSSVKNDKDNSYKLNYDQYACSILQILIIGEDSFFSKDAPFTYNLFSQSLYYTYHIYICMQILEKKYDKYISEVISDIAFNKIINHLSQNINDDASITEFKNKIHTYYLNLKTSNINIFSTNNENNGFTDLSKLFLKDLNLSELDAISNYYITISFMGFLKFHLRDVLNPNIELIL